MECSGLSSESFCNVLWCLGFRGASPWFYLNHTPLFMDYLDYTIWIIPSLDYLDYTTWIIPYGLYPMDYLDFTVQCFLDLTVQ